MGKRVQVAVRGVGGIACPFEVTALMRRGVWAVTPFLDVANLPVPGIWDVTHVPSGFKVSGAIDLAQAKRLCRLLGARHADFGARAQFGVMPTKTTSERWQAVRATYGEWKRDEGLL
jgi:hypothetical protein